MIKLPKQIPLISFELNKMAYVSNDAALNKILKITTVTDTSFHYGVRLGISLTNISQKQVSINNIVPFGKEMRSIHLRKKHWQIPAVHFSFKKIKHLSG